jgi:hypothetical protein
VRQTFRIRLDARLDVADLSKQCRDDDLAVGPATMIDIYLRSTMGETDLPAMPVPVDYVLSRRKEGRALARC